MIRDTGLGIKLEHQRSIFDRFYQVDQGTTRHAEGTGIGLAMIKELLPFMGGKINVQSSPGKGSTFVIKLPITNSANKKSVDLSQINKQFLKNELSIKSVGNQQLAETKILIIEDNPDVRLILRTMLGNRFQVVLAKDGKEGIQEAIKQIPDLIISDVMMPQHDGFQVCDILHQHSLTSHIPIILLTAKADRQSIIEGYKHGADVYLPKPFNADQLMAQIEMLFAQRQRLQLKYQDDHSLGKDLPEPDTLLQKLVHLIKSDISNDKLGIKDICTQLHISRSQLHQKVKAVTGQSTNIFIRQIRLSVARNLLSKTEKNVSEIAYEVGFKDPNYFSRVFTKTFGISPTKIRGRSNS